MELRILQDFIKRKCGEKRLRDRLHAIWWGLKCSQLRKLTVVFEVLCPNGQSTTTARSQILQGHLSRQEWCVLTNAHDHVLMNYLKFPSL
jgi:hypothetical protein